MPRNHWYNTLIMPSGSYQTLGTSEAARIEQWLRLGGTLIAYQGAVQWLNNQKLAETSYKPPPEREESNGIAYADRYRITSSAAIPGAILEAEADLTHPLLYGFHRKTLPVFKHGATVAEMDTDPWSNPIRYTDDPVLSGFVSDLNKARQKNSPYVGISRMGSGRIVRFHENTNFRGIWFGNSKLLANDLFFGTLMN